MPSYEGRVDTVGEVNSVKTELVSEPEKPASIPNPGYFAALREGEALPIGNWRRIFRERSRSGSSVLDHRYQYNGSTYGGISTGDVGWGRSYVPGISGDFRNENYAAMLQEAAAKAQTGPWDIMTFAAEFDKTHELVSKAHKRTFQRAQVILNRKGRAIRKFSEFASAWMEYRYGWRILMYDLKSAQDSAQRLSKLHKKFVDRYTVHRQDVKLLPPIVGSGSAFSIPGGTHGATGSLIDYSATRYQITDLRAGAGVEASMMSAFTINPLLTGWELVPYSFIVDWFVNVGNVIAAHTPTLGRELKYLWFSERSEMVGALTTTWRPKKDPYYFSFIGNSGMAFDEHRHIIYDRDVVPRTPFDLSFNPNLDLSKFADLAALALLNDKRLRHTFRKISR